MTSGTFNSPAPITLEDPYLKTTRARAHLTELKSALDGFAESKPYTITHEPDIDKGLYQIRIDYGEIPAVASLIVGDLLYCLRSALDQTVWALAKLTTAIPGRTQFPILDSDSAENQRAFQKQTVGVPPEAISIIKSLQPYNGGNELAVKSHLLWRLNKLGNIDKHRRIPAHGSLVNLTVTVPAGTAQPSVEAFNNRAIMTFPISLYGKFKLNPTVAINILFGDMSEDIACDFAGLDAIYEFVAHNVIPRFARFFQKSV